MSRREPEPLLEHARLTPNRSALRTGSMSMTNAELFGAVDHLARALLDVEIVEGTAVAMLLADDVPAVLLVHAARRIGAVLVPLNRRASPRELRAQLDAARVRHVVTDRTDRAVVQDLVGPGRVIHFADELASTAADGHRAGLRAMVELDAAATMLFTSGTTGRAKAAVLTHGDHAASADAWARVLGPRPDDRWLLCLPLFHVAGLAIVARASRWGAELEVHRRFDPTGVSIAIAGGASHVSLVAAQLEVLLDHTRREDVPGSLRAILLGGGPVPPDLLRRARERGWPVLTTYGMTETASGIAVGGVDAETRRDPGAYRPMPGVQIRIETGGEIAVRGPMVFGGYLDDGAGAAVVPRPEGWFRTGDLGSLGDDGLLRVEDRRDDLLVSGGENVYPAEVETVLRSHHGIVDAAVIGRPDDRWGAVPVAFVVARANGPDDEELTRHCRERLAGYKVPVAFHRVDALPRDAMGKVRRRELRVRDPATAS